MKNKKPFWFKTRQRKTLNGSLDRWRTPRVMKLQHRSKVAGLANNRNAPVDPTRIDAERARYFMEQAKLEAYRAGVPRPSFPFGAAEVIAVHTRHRDEGEGLYFRLADGRVFSGTGERAPSGLEFYE